MALLGPTRFLLSFMKIASVLAPQVAHVIDGRVVDKERVFGRLFTDRLGVFSPFALVTVGYNLLLVFIVLLR